MPDPAVNSTADLLAAARLAAIIDSSDDAIVSKTLEGQVMSWNPAAERIFGYSAAEMVGQSIFRLVPPELKKEEEEILARIARGEHVAHYETVRRRKDGKEITVSLTISPVRDSTGRVTGAASIKRDITEQKLLEAKLRQNSKMEAIGRLAGGLAHDFNNQLHALSGFAHFIERDPDLSATARQDLLQIQKAAERMAHLTRQLLAFARQQVLSPEILDLDATVADSESMLQRLIGSNIVLRLEFSPGPKWVRADRAQLVQVLLNLVINARDAMPQGGKLDVHSETIEVAPHQLTDRLGTAIEPGAYAQLEVRDAGHGISAEHLSRIFEPFYTTKEVGRGTGLGLATVEGIVSQSGGYLQIESVVGQGTRIGILLPIAPAPTRQDPPEDLPASAGGKRGRILVVDDDKQVRSVLTRLLRGEGYQVLEAGDGKEALECLELVGGGMDLVITDVVMPVMGGRELVHSLNQRHSGIAVIWISGHPLDDEPSDESGFEAQLFLQKPIAPMLLLQTVHTTLRNRQLSENPDQTSR